MTLDDRQGHKNDRCCLCHVGGWGGPPWTPSDTTEVDRETRKSKGQGVRENEKRNCKLCRRERERERERGNRRQSEEKTKQGNGKGKIT